MAPSNARNNFYILGSGCGNGKAGTQRTSEWIGLSLCRKYVDGVWTKCLISIGITLLLVPSIFAIDDEAKLEASGQAFSPSQDPTAAPNTTVSSSLLEGEDLALQFHSSPERAESTREQPVFTSVQTLQVAETHSLPSLPSNSDNRTNQKSPGELDVRVPNPPSPAEKINSVLTTSSGVI